MGRQPVVVDHNIGSWNHLEEWLSRLDAVRRALASPA
jgi:hypothetical protein